MFTGGISAKQQRPVVWASLLALFTAIFGLLGAARGQGGPVVHVATIEGEIDRGLAPYVARVIQQAERAGAAAVALEIDTFGGRVDSAVAIRDALLGAQIPTVAYVNPRAISAGALIALSARDVVMAEGATIGAAAPVVAGPGGAEPAGEKATSYVRKEFRATAELRGRPPELAEAMVDADVAVPGVVEKGKLLTLTTSEALALGIADRQAGSLEEALAGAGIRGAEIVRAEPNWAEGLVRFLTNPAVSSLLMALGTLGLLIELRSPGFGVPGIVGILSLGLFFWAHWLTRLVGWEEVALIGVGAVLIALEAFVIPGFGVAGVLGTVAVLAGLSLSLVGAGVTFNGVAMAIGQVAFALLVALLGAVGFLRLLPKLPFGRRLVLAGGLGAEVPVQGVLPSVEEVTIGDQGVAATPLRPAGIATFAGARVDVVSSGDYVAAGEAVEVIHVDGGRVVVRRVQSA
ncbi:MAG TPA: NfeD family protein [Candidatus Nanopelagicales bacterium]|nr:NfeD family protein [Candidatus Nanopelagicales bacterium]